MKRITNRYGLLVVCLLSAGVGAEEQVRAGNAAGIFAGESARLVVKSPASETTAIDATSAWSLIGVNSVQFHADCLWHNYDLIKTKELMECLSVYYGVGGRLKLNNSNAGLGNGDEDSRLGVRSPLGVSYALQDNPVELFAEVVPILDILPEQRFGVGVGIGARYYFKLL